MQKRRDLILTGFALFAMLFGAGNLIFPPEVGLNTGKNWIFSALGFITTGAGLPLTGILAASIGGRQDAFATKVSPLFNKIFNAAMVLSIGPLLALPRTGATSFEILFSGENSGNVLYKILFLLIFFGVTFLFSIKASEVVDRIGKILTPILIIMLIIIIFKGVISPLGEISLAKEPHSFKYGFINGYQTMDTLAAIIFSSIIIKSIREKRNLDSKEEFSFLLKSSIIAVGALAVVYGGLIYIGATSESILGNSSKSGPVLLSLIVNKLLGNIGKIILSLCVVGACLTTSIGLATSTSEYFSRNFKVSYMSVLIITTLVSLFFSYFGVGAIVKISVPILVFIYPIAIILIILNLFKKKIKNDYIYKGCVIGAGIVSFYETIKAMGLKNEALDNIYSKIPFADLGLGWLLPAIGVGLLFSLIKNRGDEKND